MRARFARGGQGPGAWGLGETGDFGIRKIKFGVVGEAREVALDVGGSAFACG
ncbi:MAG: hypothetical protein P4L56_25415 [Candidatus Sulfopaludibacter sp.]|nr:hypothetical protein [Candidatus Sulfopaludibacter sp.]